VQLRRMGLHHDVQERRKKAEEVQDAIQPSEPNDEREREGNLRLTWWMRGWR
jgi:hypothetical protein